MPKYHSLEHHALYLFKKFQGFADLAEDAGERAHQSETKLDLRWAPVRSHAKREIAKSNLEAKEHHPEVCLKIEQMNTTLISKQAKKRKICIDNTGQSKGMVKKSRQEMVWNALISND